LIAKLTYNPKSGLYCIYLNYDLIAEAYNYSTALEYFDLAMHDADQDLLNELKEFKHASG